MSVAVEAVCTCGHCQACGLRRAWAEGKYSSRPYVPKWFDWSREEIDDVRALAGTMSIPDLAEEISRRHGVPRTPKGLVGLSQREGISLQPIALSVWEFRPIFGVCHKTVRHWIKAGLIVAREHVGPDGGATLRIEPDEIRRFIESYPWMYDHRAMKRGHPFTQLAEVIQKRHPYMSPDKAAEYLKLSVTRVYQFIHAGVLPAETVPGTGLRAACYRIPVSAVVELARRRKGQKGGVG